MKYFLRSTVCAAALALTGAIPATAITPQEVSDSLKAYYEGAGLTYFIGSQDQSSNSLTQNNIEMSFDMPEDRGVIKLTIDWFKLSDVGGGKVEVTTAETARFSVDTKSSSDKDVNIQGHITLKDFLTLVSGATDDMMVDYKVGLAEIATDKMTGGKGDVEGVVAVAISDMASLFHITKAADKSRTMDGTTKSGPITFTADLKKPGGGGVFTVSSTIDGISGVASMTMPEHIDFKNPLSSGMAYDQVYDLGKSTIDANFDDGGDTFAMTSSSEGGRFAGVMSASGVSYDISQKGVAMNMSASKLPIPSISLAYDEFSFGLGVPLKKSDTPSDVRLLTSIRGLMVGEEIWSMVDPGKSLSRDPATIVIDLVGKVMLLTDLSNPENLKDLKGPPAIPVSVALNELTAIFAGAVLIGSGAVRFNMENTESAGGMPQPIGEVNLRLKGGFGLMDKLVELGLVPPDAAMGIRAMSGAFAKPVGDDELESKIELTEDGGILANGQRIK